MRITVKVKPRSKKEEVIKTGLNSFTVAVKEPPIEGRANEAAVKMMSEYLGVPSSAMRIIKGKTSKNKVIEIAQ